MLCFNWRKFWRKIRRQKLVDCNDIFTFHFREKVRVSIHCCGNIGVSEIALNNFCLNAAFKKPCSKIVPEGVAGYMRNNNGVILA